MTRIPLALAFLTTSFEARLSAIILAALSDFFDGWIARRFALESRLGAIMDPFTDKLFVLIASIALLVERDFHPLFFCLFFLRDIVLITTLIIHKKLLRSAEITSNIYGKIITLLQFLILTTTVAGIEQLQYLSLLFPYLSLRYFFALRANYHLPRKKPFFQKIPKELSL
ncbi:MAG: CDP-alcohol phosphatidyltransferase family protein [Chlamydiia bacterium]